MLGKVLMPKATAIWLIDNTSLSFEQIADFCGMHLLEVQALADSEQSEIIVGVSPVLNGMLSKDDINKNSADFIKQSRNVKHKYTPMAHRQNRPDAILWIIKNHPNITDSQICKLVRTTKNTITAIRERTHKSIAEIQPRNPVLLGICSEFDLTKAIIDADKKAEIAQKRLEKNAKKLAKKDSDSQSIEQTETFE